MIDTLLWRAKDQRVHVSIPYVSNSCFIFHAQTFFNKKKKPLSKFKTIKSKKEVNVKSIY